MLKAKVGRVMKSEWNRSFECRTEVLRVSGETVLREDFCLVEIRTGLHIIPPGHTFHSIHFYNKMPVTLNAL
jgi:hypothetical protein